MKPQNFTIKQRLIAISVFLILSLTILITYNNYFAVASIRSKVYDTVQGTVRMYSNQMDRNLHSVDTFLSNYLYMNYDIKVLDQNPKNTTQWFASLDHIQDNFNTSLPSYNIDSFFLYIPEKDAFVRCNSVLDKQIVLQIQEAIDQGVFFSKENAGTWVPLEVKGTYYLVRTLQVQNSYIGAWIKIDEMIEEINGKGDITENNLYFATCSGALLSSQKNISISDFHNDTNDGYQMVEINGETNLLVAQKVPFSNLSLIALIPDQQITSRISTFFPVIIFVAFAVSAILVVNITFLNRWILATVTKLTQAFQQVKNGQLHVFVSEKNVPVEYKEMISTFNSMVEEIHSLKIDVYEEKLTRKQIEIDQLQLQITPHFLLNCLNMIYQLSESNETGLAQKMTQVLSNHLRFTLYSDSTILLDREIQHVQNYIELSSIRYPNAIIMVTDIDSLTLDTPVVPWLLLNFVENTIKYEVEVGKTTEIHISTHSITKEGKAYTHVCIWDTGNGFRPDLLQKLQNVDEYVNSVQHEHIGISNVIQRARLLLGDCDFCFSNRPSAGAQIDIYVPHTKQPLQSTKGLLPCKL